MSFGVGRWRGPTLPPTDDLMIRIRYDTEHIHVHTGSLSRSLSMKHDDLVCTCHETRDARVLHPSPSSSSRPARARSVLRSNRVGRNRAVGAEQLAARSDLPRAVRPKATEQCLPRNVITLRMVPGGAL